MLWFSGILIRSKKDNKKIRATFLLVNLISSFSPFFNVFTPLSGNNVSSSLIKFINWGKNLINSFPILGKLFDTVLKKLAEPLKNT